jgi:signal peptidase I
MSTSTRRGTRRRTARRARWARAWSWTTTLVLSALGLFALLAVVVPLVLGTQTYTVLTGSMRPGMPPGTLVAVRETPSDRIRVGDVVTYQLRPGEPEVVTHRVVGVTHDNAGGTLLTTRGDANDVADPPVQPAQVRGVVVYAIPFVGYPGMLVGGTTRGTLVLVLGAGVIGYGVVVLVADLVRSRRRRAAAAGIAAMLLAAPLALGMPGAPARADEPSPAPPGTLQLSTDGTTWSDGAALPVFTDAGPLAPGAPVTDRIWVRNTSVDLARLSLDVAWAPASGAPEDAALASAFTVLVDGVPTSSGVSVAPGLVEAGAIRGVELTLLIRPDAGADTRDAALVVHPVVRLAEALPDDADPGSAGAPPDGGLAATGGTLGLAVLLAGAGVAVAAGGIRILVRPR